MGVVPVRVHRHQQCLLHTDVRGLDGRAEAAEEVEGRSVLAGRGTLLPLAVGHGRAVVRFGWIQK